MTNGNGSEGKEWYVVAGFRGDDVTQETADFLVVQAEDLGSALREAQNQDDTFSAVSALSEKELRAYLGRIEAKKSRLDHS